jgi:hypothetical protein
MKNILNTKTDGTPALLSNVDESGNSLFVNGTEISSSSWVGEGTYTFTAGSHTYTISKAPDNDGNYQLLKVSDYTYQFVKIVSKSIREELDDIKTALSSLESDAVTKSAGGQITGGGLSFTSGGMPQQTTGSGVAMTMDTFANGGQLKWQNWDDVTVGKAKDSNKLGGAGADDAATNSTIAKRTSSGYIYATYLNSSNGNQATMTTSSSALYANSDGFLRKCTPTNFLKMFDSGWVTISGVGYYRRQSGFVIVLVNGYSITTHTWTTLTTLPSGYRPAYALNATICGGDHRQYVGELQVTTGGVVRAYVNTTASYYGQIIFPV